MTLVSYMQERVVMKVITNGNYLQRVRVYPRAVAIPIRWSENGFRVSLNLTSQPRHLWLNFLKALRQLTDQVR